MTTTAPLRAAGLVVLLLVAALAALALSGPAAAADGEVRPAGTVAARLAAVEGTAAPAPAPGRAVEGPLPGARTSRRLGLPVALAVLALVGVASLQVRVLLAEPAPGRSA